MRDPRPKPTREQDEAAEWLARMGNHSISTETVREFRQWRDNPVNDAAYQEAEAFWDASGRQAADPEIIKLTQAALTPRPRLTFPSWLQPPGRRWTLGLAALLIAGLAVAFSQLAFPSYATGPGEQRIIRLADGSRLHLNVESRVRVRYRGTERRLILTRGEAFFDVAHDPDRPFVVEADGTAVRALGTRFDVRRHGDQVQVTLLEGSVRVTRSRTPDAWTLTPNQTLTVPDRGAAMPAKTDAARTTSWTTGRLSFRDTPLGDAVAEVNRYGQAPIVLEGEALKARRVTGYFDVGDSESFIKGVSAIFDLEAQRSPDGAVTLRTAGG